MKKYLLTITSISILMLSGPTQAWDFFKKREKPVEVQIPKIEVPPQDSFAQVSARAAKNLAQVENLISQNQLPEALEVAKNTLDEIRIKVGLDPKTKFSEKIETNNVFTNADLLKDYASLFNSQKEDLAKVVSKHKNGYYLDLLNYSKRAMLLYQKAKLKILTAQQTLSAKDSESITNNLVKLVNIPIMIADSNATEPFLLFDSEVAQEEQVEMFNHEIEDYFLAALNKSHDDFWSVVDQNKKKISEEHFNSIKYISGTDYKSCQDSLIRWWRAFAHNRNANDRSDHRSDRIVDYPISQSNAAKICRLGVTQANCVTDLLSHTNLEGRQFDFYGNYALPEVTYTLEQAQKLCSSVR